jgi:hypothetical protein
MYKAHAKKNFQIAIKQRELSAISENMVHGAFREVLYYTLQCRDVEFHA